MAIRFLDRASWGATLAVSLGILLFSGCDSGPSNPGTVAPEAGGPLPWLKVTTPNYGMFYATSETHAGRPTHYQSGGILFTTTGQSQSTSGGTMTASNLQIPVASGSNYFSIGQPTFGAISTFGLSGDPASGIPAFTDQLYVPDEIVMSTPSVSGTGVSKSSGVTVTWNVDPNNADVLVYFVYDYMISQIADPALPSIDIGKSWVVPDNGSFTIPASDLASVPTGAYLRVVIGRGNGKLTGTSTHPFYVYGASLADGVFKVTP